MYLLVENGRGVILDPFYSNEHVESILAVSPIIDYIILTHEHYDHISGTNALRELFHCPVLCSGICAERIQNPAYNLSRYEETYLGLQTGESFPKELLPIEDYIAQADETFFGEKAVRWQDHKLVLTETPGHSPGSICILLNEDKLFSGDSLLMNNAFATRLPGRNKSKYKQITQRYLSALPPEVLVYPGHYESFHLWEHPEWTKWRVCGEEEYNDKS